MTTSSGSSGGSNSGSNSRSNKNKSSAPSPLQQNDAPSGAYLGTTSTGNSLVSNGDGTASIVGSAGGKDSRDRTAGQTVQLPGSTSLSRTSASLAPSGGVSTRGGSVDTTVTQTPSAEGPESTSITGTPRSDFSVVLAGQTGKRPDRSPSRSNNFVSLISGAGSLGRRSENAKRTLIGGA